MNLKKMGWSPFWEAYRNQDQIIGRIVSVRRSFCQAWTEQGVVNVYLPGKILNSDHAEGPTVGDWVILNPPFIDQQDLIGCVLEKVLPRKSYLARQTSGGKKIEQIMAVNLDYVFIVTSANMDMSLNRIQRYLLLANHGNAKPVLVVSKFDLFYYRIKENSGHVFSDESKKESLGKMITDRFPYLDFHFTSLFDVNSINELKLKWLQPGTTSVFVGSSGVGKSSLVNHILGRNLQDVQSIREADDKGRHTTTSREMFEIPRGGWIIDTPGLREVSLMGSDEDLDDTFEKLSTIMRSCRFKDCSHQGELGCAVEKALLEDELEIQEWENYLKMKRELEHLKRKKSKRLASENKREWKKVSKNMKQRRKIEGW